MTTNGYINIKGEVYKAHVFVDNKIKSDDMGERLDCTAVIRIPITKRQTINVALGDVFLLNGEEWKAVKVTINRDGYGPHYHLTGVK